MNSANDADAGHEESRGVVGGLAGPHHVDRQERRGCQRVAGPYRPAGPQPGQPVPWPAMHRQHAQAEHDEEREQEQRLLEGEVAEDQPEHGQHQVPSPAVPPPPDVVGHRGGHRELQRQPEDVRGPPEEGGEGECGEQEQPERHEDPRRLAEQRDEEPEHREVHQQLHRSADEHHRSPGEGREVRDQPDPEEAHRFEVAGVHPGQVGEVELRLVGPGRQHEVIGDEERVAHQARPDRDLHHDQQHRGGQHRVTHQPVGPQVVGRLEVRAPGRGGGGGRHCLTSHDVHRGRTTDSLPSDRQQSLDLAARKGYLRISAVRM